MKNHICHVYNHKRECHAQPFVVCDKHWIEADADYGSDPSFELRVLGKTDAWCGICFREQKVLRPLLALEFIRESCTDAGVEPYIDIPVLVEHLGHLARALGYKSVEDAYFQLEVIRSNKGADHDLN